MQSDLAQRLKKAFKILGISIRKASEICEIPYRTLQDYASGRMKPGADALAKMTQKLRISADWLLTGQGKMFVEREFFISKDRTGELSLLLSHRMKELRIALKLTQEEMAKKIGLDPHEYASLESSGRLDLQMLHSLKEAFPTLNLNWLLLGKGSMFTTDTEIQVLPFTKENLKGYKKEFEFSSDYVIIPYCKEARVSAGPGAFPSDFPAEPLILPKEYLRRFFGLTSFQGLSLVPVSGRSMEMTIPDKSLAVVRDWRLDGVFLDGRVYVLVVDELLYVKRVYFDKKNKKLYLISDNHEIPRIEIDWDDKVHIIGRVVGCISFVEVG